MSKRVTAKIVSDSLDLPIRILDLKRAWMVGVQVVRMVGKIRLLYR